MPKHETLTALTLSHAAALSAIHHAAFEADGLRGWSETQCREMLAREEYFGHIMSAPSNRDTLLNVSLSFHSFILLRHISAKETEIISLATHPTHQRKGLGKQLIEYAISALNGATLHLETRENNAPALALYHTLGFTQTGIRPNYYKDGKGGRVNAVMMCYPHSAA